MNNPSQEYQQHTSWNSMYLLKCLCCLFVIKDTLFIYLFLSGFCLGALQSVSMLPGQVGELGVHWAGDHLGVDGSKLVHTVAERNDLSWTDKRAARDTQINIYRWASTAFQKQYPWNWHSGRYLQVQRIEEEDEIFAFVVWQLHLLELPIDDSCSLPVRRRLRNCPNKSSNCVF